MPQTRLLQTQHLFEQYLQKLRHIDGLATFALYPGTGFLDGGYAEAPSFQQYR